MEREQPAARLTHQEIYQFMEGDPVILTTGGIKVEGKIIERHFYFGKANYFIEVTESNNINYEKGIVLVGTHQNIKSND